MKSNKANNGQVNGDPGTTEVDHILEGLRPRMRAARIRQVRFMGAIIALVPLMGLGAMALGQEDDGGSISVASGGDERSDADPDEGVGTDIGEAGDDEVAAPESDDEGHEADKSAEDHDTDDRETTDEAPESVKPEDLVHDIEVATFGVVKVKVEAEGVTLIEAVIHDPWEFVSAETSEEGDLVIRVTDGENIKIITIGEGLWDEFHVKLDDFVPPTTTTTTVKPEPKPEPDPAPPIVDRIVVEVPPAGSFVVEREGEVLWGGNVQPNEGFEYDIISNEGWKVHVAFVDEQFIYHGKAYIDDNGQLQTHLWTEEKPPPAVIQWAEISCVGAAQFKLQEGLILVKAVEKAEGVTASWPESWVESAVVTFVRAETSETWTMEAWPLEGQIQTAWSGPEVVC